MSTTTEKTNGRKWVEHVGAAGLPKDFDKLIPLGGQGVEAPKKGYQSGTAWTRLKSGMVLRCDPLPVGAGGAPAHAGAGWAPTGNNFLVTAGQADAACAGNFSVDTSGDASQTSDIQAWAQSGVNTGDNIFVWSGDTQKLYQYVKTSLPGAATLFVCGKGAMPDPRNAVVAGGCPPAADGTAQVKDASGNCVPAGSPGTSTLAKVAPWALGAAGLLLVGGVIYAVVEHGGSGGSAKAAGHHHAHDNPARDRKRDRHGRFK